MQAAVMAVRGRPARATWRRRLGVPGGSREAARGGPAGARRPAPTPAPMARPHGPSPGSGHAHRPGTPPRLAAAQGPRSCRGSKPPRLDRVLRRRFRLPDTDPWSAAACARSHIDRPTERRPVPDDDSHRQCCPRPRGPPPRPGSSSSFGLAPRPSRAEASSIDPGVNLSPRA